MMHYIDQKSVGYRNNVRKIFLFLINSDLLCVIFIKESQKKVSTINIKHLRIC